jgi:hypothetical protein
MNSVIDAHEFLKLSSFINYQLSGTPINWRAILSLVMNKQRPDAELLLESLSYLGAAYGQKKRKLGPLMILHPLRVAALLAKTQDNPNTLDILTAIFHDLREDIIEFNYTEPIRQTPERYSALLEKVDSKTNWLLEERIFFLTRNKEQTYRQYLEKLIEQASTTPEVILIKLIDRLDNTYDLRLDIIDEAERTEFYKVIFDALFTKSYRGLLFINPHQITSKINGAMRLYQLYKNMLFLTLIRINKLKLDETSNRLFDSLAIASSNEAQNIILHIFAYHLCDPNEQKWLLIDVSSQARGKRNNDAVADDPRVIRKLCSARFDPEDKSQFEAQIKELYEDKKLMCQTALVFLIVFTNFLNDSDFVIQGI